MHRFLVCENGRCYSVSHGDHHTESLFLGVSFRKAYFPLPMYTSHVPDCHLEISYATSGQSLLLFYDLALKQVHYYNNVRMSVVRRDVGRGDRLGRMPHPLCLLFCVVSLLSHACFKSGLPPVRHQGHQIIGLWKVSMFLPGNGKAIKISGKLVTTTWSHCLTKEYVKHDSHDRAQR